MTIKEARDVLQEQIDKYGQEYDDEGIEALEIAIKILEQEPCEDVISRQSAINAMLKIEQDDVKKYGCSIPEGFDSTPAIEVLNNLPPITSQPKKGHWIDKRCSICGCHSILGLCVENYCANCGAKMEVEE